MLSPFFRGKLLRRLSLASSLVAALALSGPTAPASPPSASREGLSYTLTLTTSPRIPWMEQEVTGVMQIEGNPLPERVCMGYILKELGDGIILKRRTFPPFPIARMSCRRPYSSQERFPWGIMWDGKYEVYGYSTRGKVIESKPLPIELVVHP